MKRSIDQKLRKYFYDIPGQNGNLPKLSNFWQAAILESIGKHYISCVIVYLWPWRLEQGVSKKGLSMIILICPYGALCNLNPFVKSGETFSSPIKHSKINIHYKSKIQLFYVFTRGNPYTLQVRTPSARDLAFPPLIEGRIRCIGLRLMLM